MVNQSETNKKFDFFKKPISIEENFHHLLIKKLINEFCSAIFLTTQLQLFLFVVAYLHIYTHQEQTQWIQHNQASLNLIFFSILLVKGISTIFHSCKFLLKLTRFKKSRTIAIIPIIGFLTFATVSLYMFHSFDSFYAILNDTFRIS
jgi:cytochrome bd-type quinol oxidase subunit 2